MTPIDGTARSAFEDAVGYRFENKDLLERALTHRSYIAENQGRDSYERLEFLGDAVLQLAVTHDLYAEYPELAEGHMAKIRAAVVSEVSLAVVARTWCLPDVLVLGKGEEQTGGRGKNSILSDVVESVLGAIYIEAGFERASEVVRLHWTALIAERAPAPGMRDYKTRLQEALAQDGKLPRYEVTESGPEHRKDFVAQVFVDDALLGSGKGSSKKRAEQAAAQVAATTLSAG